MGQLLASAIGCAQSHVECTVFLVNAIESLASGIPQRVAHLHVGGCQLFILTVLHAPHLTGDAAGVMLAPDVLISLYIIIYNRAVPPHTRIGYGQSREEGLTSSVDAHGIGLLEGTVWENDLIGGGVAYSAEEYRIVVEPSCCVFSTAMCGQSLGRTTFCSHHVYIQTAHTVACEGYMLAVWTPGGFAVIGRVCGQLACCASLRGNRVDISLVSKSYLLTVRTDAYGTQPQWSIGGLNVKHAACEHDDYVETSVDECLVHTYLHIRWNIYVKKQSKSKAPSYFSILLRVKDRIHIRMPLPTRVIQSVMAISSTCMGWMMAHAPRIPAILNTLLPITLPTASPSRPL